MREPLGFDVQALRLAVARRRALDFFDHMPQVVRLAAHFLAPGREVLLASLELVQALVCVAHRGPLHGRSGVGIEHVALSVGSQQGLGFVLTVQVHEERTELGQDTDGRRAAVDPRAGSPFPADFPLQYQATVVWLDTEGGEGR